MRLTGCPLCSSTQNASRRLIAATAQCQGVHP
jgi:hypothetical protein